MTDSEPPSDSEEPQDEKWYDRTRYQVLLFVGGIVLFVLVVGWALDWYIEPCTSGQKKDLVQSLGLLTAGVAGAVGIFFTWRGQRITQESLQDTRENSEENLHLAREGQITERFTRAIDHLGATDDKGVKKLEIRLGGIYALERIAVDSLAMESSPGRDYSTVMEVLTAYVRENTTQAPEPPEGSSEEPSTSNTTADIQAILDVLGRTQTRAPEEYRTSLDLSEANLQGADLQGANLQGANLQKASLQGAYLVEANFQEASLGDFLLGGADLQGADLYGANLYRAELHLANLQKAFLVEANLQGAVGISNEDLEQQARSLEGATMPDWQKYEDWVKDKESRKEDGESDVSS